MRGAQQGVFVSGSIEGVIRKGISAGLLALARYNRERKRALEGPHPFLTGIYAPMASSARCTICRSWADCRRN